MLVKVDGIWYEVIELNRLTNAVRYFDDLENIEEITYLAGRYLSDETLEVMRDEERRIN